MSALEMHYEVWYLTAYLEVIMADGSPASEGSAIDLQREVEKLKAQLETAKQSSSTVPPKKRKKPVDEDVIMVPRSPKRAKRDHSPARRSGRSEVSIERDFDFTDVGETGESKMCQSMA